ncbi:Fc.00g007430.m01.CDS01 [Cosmosporella sp. VM-42]
MGVIIRDNDALDINPPAGDTHLSEGGSDWLWAATAIYIVSFIAFFALSLKPRNNERIFHYLFTVALFVGSIAYFAMASDLGFSVIRTSLNRSDAASYQIFFVKYVNWVVAWPVVIIALGLISGVSWATMVFNVFLSWIWVISYLCSAYTATSYKWGFYAFGTIAWLLLAYQTLLTGLLSARRLNLSRDYILLAGWLNLLWLLYPIAFGVSDGGNSITVTKSLVYFGILDVLMIPVLAFLTLVLARKWDYALLNLHFTQYGRVRQGEGVFPEKKPVSGTVPAAVPEAGITSAV